MLVGTHAKVLDGLAGVLLATEQDSVRASGRTERKLVEGEDLTAGLQDALLSRSGEAKSRDRKFGDLQQTNVIRNGTDSHDDLGVAICGIRSLLENAGKRDGRAVDLGEEQTVEDRLQGKYI